MNWAAVDPGFEKRRGAGGSGARPQDYYGQLDFLKKLTQKGVGVRPLSTSGSTPDEWLVGLSIGIYRYSWLGYTNPGLPNLNILLRTWFDQRVIWTTRHETTVTTATVSHPNVA